MSPRRKARDHDDDGTLPIDALTPDPENARVHTERNAALVEASLREVGAARSIVIDEQGVVLAGNQTVKGARDAGIARVRVVDADGSELIAVRRAGLTPEQKRRLALFDNRAAELAEWDGEQLAAFLEADPAALAGLFDRDELDRALDALAEATEAAPPPDPDAPSPPPRARLIALVDLHDHPRNYRTHPDDQIAHLVASIEANGFYRNVVTARDLTILSGHGVVKAARAMGLDRVPVVRLPFERDDPRALKVLAGDNEVAHLGEIDDRALSEILREIREADAAGLLGTGYDDAMLANLVYVTRPQSEIRDFDEAAAWAGMPEYNDGARGDEFLVRLHVADRADLDRMLTLLGLPAYDPAAGGQQRALSSWWPPREKADMQSIRFVEDAPPAPPEGSPSSNDDDGLPPHDDPLSTTIDA